MVPGLQAGNIEMLSWLADLYTAQGNVTGASLLTGMASGIHAELLSELYVPGRGYWSCLYPNNSQLQPVRSVVDFVYITRGLSASGRGPGLPSNVGREMAAFFQRELEADGWLRALSLEDELNRQIPRQDVILRPDHGITGGSLSLPTRFSA